MRRHIMDNNPHKSFGEISRMVGEEWKKLSDWEKKEYELRAT